MIENNFFVHPKDGLQKTLQEMKRLELKAIENNDFKSFVERNFLPLKNCVDCLLTKLWRFVVDNFKYKEDEPDEKIQAPYVLLNTRYGDCDDFALFIKSVLTLVGIPCFYLLMGKTPEGYSHIVVVANETILDGANKKFNFIKPDYINFGVPQI